MTPQELKNSILQLAIQGKLVEQLPLEGTAEELFAQIQQEKKRLIAEKKIKKEKPLPEITEDEKPFDIPESWKWVRVQEIVCLNPKNDLSDELEVSFIPMALVDDGYRNNHSFEIKKWGDIKKGFTHFADGDIGIAKITPCFQNRKSVVFRNLKNGCGAGTTELSIVRVVNDLLSRDFLLWFFKSAYFIENGVKSFTGTAGQQRIHKDYLSMCCFPLPPLAEQKRIVAKIEELLPYIDRYEQAWSTLEQFNSRFPEDMKKSLLQYAIQGKLVEQRPGEGTAEELFAQIQKEKQQLIAEKKIKKEKPLPEITEDEKPFDIPESWKWVRVGSLLHYIDTGKSFKCDEIPPTNDKCGIIKVSAVTWGQFKENESKTCYSNDLWVDEYAIHENDFLICRANTAALVGGCVIVDQISKRLMLSDKVLRLHFSEMLYSYYVLWALRTPMVRNQFSAAATGTSESMKNISQDMIKNTLIPLPPLDEQKRIVEKLEQLLPLCEKLQS